MALLPLQIETILGQVVHVVIEPSSLVKDLKNTIAEIDGIPPDFQVIFFNGKELIDERNISSCKLYENCSLKFTGKQLGGAADMNIFLKAFSGKTTQIQVNPDDTVKMVKKKIEELQGVQVDGQQLIYGGKQLHNNFKLKDYNILPDSAIFLVLRLLGGGSLENEYGSPRGKVTVLAERRVME